MKPNNFTLSNLDTDSISFCKSDMTSFSKTEREFLVSQVNSLFSEEIQFSDDGFFPRFIVLKAKNYIMLDEKGKLKLKGSSLKSSTLEPMLKTMLGDFINTIVYIIEENERHTKLQEIYMKYIFMVANITDIKSWCTKKTLSATTFSSERKNETDIVDAIKDSEYVEGDKIYLYATFHEKWSLAERFDGKYSHVTYYEKIFKTAQRFSTIMNTKELFPNFALKKNIKLLKEKYNIEVPVYKEEK